MIKTSPLLSLSCCHAAWASSFDRMQRRETWEKYLFAVSIREIVGGRKNHTTRMRGKLSGNAAGWLIEEGKRRCGPARRIECLGWTEKKGGGRRRNHSSGKLCWLLFSFFLLLFSSTLPEAERKRGRRKALLMLFTEEEEGRGSLLPSSSFSSKVHCSFLSMWGWRREGFFPPSSSQSAAWVGQSSPLLSTPKPPPKVRLWYADCGRRNKRFAEKGKVCIFAKMKGGGPLRHARRDVVKFVHFFFSPFPE